MSLRFRRRLRLPLGFHLNLSHAGASLSWSPFRGLSLGKRGVTVSIPHTGLSVTEPWTCPSCGYTPSRDGEQR